VPPDRLETLWAELRPHIEWAEGFCLIFVFAQHPQPVAFLRRRLAESLQLRSLKLQTLTPASPEECQALAENVLAHRRGPGAGPLWLELWQHADQLSWQQARAHFLHRLNERRFVLERDVGLPVVLVLPESARGRVFEQAPDLWAVRVFTAGLPIPATEPAAKGNVFGTERPAAGSGPTLVEEEWARLWEKPSDRTGLDPWDAFAAFDAAVERGDLNAARLVARQSLDLVRSQVAADGSETTRRNLSVAWNKVGDSEHPSGNLEAARSAYRESLEIDRQLRTRFGDTPQALRDLSVSLNNVGRVERDLGNLEAARSAYRESLELRRQLRTSFGDTPQALRDLSVSLNNVGQVEGDLGNLEAARSAYRESLEIARQLRTSFGDTPQALRDLSISLDNVGQVEGDLGNLEAARNAYRESLEICRQLCAAFPKHPQFRRDLDWITQVWDALNAPAGEPSSAGSGGPAPAAGGQPSPQDKPAA
jgi:tetratricopeptide (TPR) repeat protein